MTICVSIQILDRVSAATPKSRIAVFKKGNDFDCFFADTVVGRERVQAGKGLVGVFDGSEGNNAVWHALKKATGN